ncbi:MAG: hypothetical protein HYX75_17895 [Acidobacteria bacterium]|nr:hypothetical protein [Acidobacteriota bacterium]
MHSVLSERLDPFRLRRVLEITDFSPNPPRFALLAVFLMIRDDARAYSRRRLLRRILAGVPGLGKDEHDAIWNAARERELLLRRIALLNASRDLFKYWHIIHVPLAQTMYITMSLHIGVALMTGYL